MKLNTHYTTEARRGAAADWRENDLGPSLYYSYRDTVYSRADYPSTVHYHDYYELVVFVEGDIRYICEDETYRPHPGDIILIPPGKLHMSILEGGQTRYRRHVFYLYPDAFSAVGGDALTAFLLDPEGVQLTLPADKRDEMLALLDRLDTVLSSDEHRDRALGVALAMQAFHAFGSAEPGERAAESYLPRSVVALRRYIDAHFREIESVTEVAAALFYTREHVARLFRLHLNTTVIDYIRTRRVAYAQTLMGEDLTFDEISDRAGFRSTLAFSRAFRAVTGMTPFEFRRHKG